VKAVRFSDFNVWTPDSDGLIVYNTLTGALLTFNRRTANEVLAAMQQDNITAVPKRYLLDFARDGVVIEDSYDELSVVKARNMLGRTQNELILSVMLTMACNFRCRYCFQSRGTRPKAMGHEVEHRVVSLISREARKKDRVSIDWYGGEPLLRFSQLVRMNNAIAGECKRCDTEYLLSVTTNGYLLTPEVIKYLSGFNVTHLQITLDGPAETHDFSRPLANGDGTFTTILSNIRRAVEAGVPVVVRVNVWKPNVGRVSELYDILEENGLKNKVNVVTKPVLSSEANPCQANCLPASEAAQLNIETYRNAATKGWWSCRNWANYRDMSSVSSTQSGNSLSTPTGTSTSAGSASRSRKVWAVSSETARSGSKSRLGHVGSGRTLFRFRNAECASSCLSVWAVAA